LFNQVSIFSHKYAWSKQVGAINIIDEPILSHDVFASSIKSEMTGTETLLVPLSPANHVNVVFTAVKSSPAVAAPPTATSFTVTVWVLVPERK
jgi:hypothetical protein